jgi:hypothetical protein
MTEKKDNNRDARMLYLSYGFSHPLITPNQGRIQRGAGSGQAPPPPHMYAICICFIYIFSSFNTHSHTLVLFL